jgi:hypothetical protein
MLSPTTLKAPRFCAGVSAPEIQSSFDTHQKHGNGTACFQKQLFRSRKIVSTLVKHCRVDVVLVAQIGNGFAFDQMLAQDGDLLFRAKITSAIIVHRARSFGPRVA